MAAPVCMMLVAACDARKTPAEQSASTLIVYNAGSLARPIRIAFDSFATGRRITLQQESAGSLESARKITELGRVPDVIALADAEIFPQLLMPKHVEWFLPFARNRMVIAYRSNLDAAQVPDSTNWWKILGRANVRVGRSDPARDPNGYRVLLTLQLVERTAREPGLAARLLQRWGDRDVRAASAELVALLQAGEVDYIWAYESVARAAALKFVRISEAVDLSSDKDSANYALARVRIPGTSLSDSIWVRGAAIRFALSIPREAAHQELAAEFVHYITRGDGVRVLRSAHLDVLEGAAMGGDSARAPLRVRTQ